MLTLLISVVNCCRSCYCLTSWKTVLSSASSTGPTPLQHARTATSQSLWPERRCLPTSSYVRFASLVTSTITTASRSITSRPGQSTGYRVTRSPCSNSTPKSPQIRLPVTRLQRCYSIHSITLADNIPSSVTMATLLIAPLHVVPISYKSSKNVVRQSCCFFCGLFVLVSSFVFFNFWFCVLD